MWQEIETLKVTDPSISKIHPRTHWWQSVINTQCCLTQRATCVFLYCRLPAELCVRRGFWVGNVTARHQSQTDSGDQTLMWHLPIQLTRRAHPSLICSDSWKTHTQTHTLKTDGSADSHSMIEKHLQGPDSISLPLKRGADDGVVALCHYDVKHNVSDALCFI